MCECSQITAGHTYLSGLPGVRQQDTSALTFLDCHINPSNICVFSFSHMLLSLLWFTCTATETNIVSFVQQAGPKPKNGGNPLIKVLNNICVFSAQHLPSITEETRTEKNKVIFLSPSNSVLQGWNVFSLSANRRPDGPRILASVA